MRAASLLLSASACVATIPVATTASAAVARQEPAPAVAPALEPLSLQRSWPESGSVAVVEVRGRRDGSYELHYRLEWKPAPEGRTRFTFVAPMLARIDGLPADAPEVNLARSSREAQMTSLCDFEVDARGSFAGPLEVEPAVNRAIESCVRRGVLSLDDADRQRATLVSPRNRHGLVKPVRDLWDQWCGAWDGRVARPGAGERVELLLPMGADGVPAAALRTFVLASRSDESSVVRLSTLQDGEEFARLVDRLSNAQVPEDKRRTISECRREVEAEAEFAPGLKLLRYQHTTRATTLYEGAEEPLVEQETRSFVVDWTPKPFGPEPTPGAPSGGEREGARGGRAEQLDAR
jgi:hypothetical protein